MYRLGEVLVGMRQVCHRLKAMPGGARTAQWELSLAVLLAQRIDTNWTRLHEVLSKQVWFEFGATQQDDAIWLWLERLLAEWGATNVIMQRDDMVWLKRVTEWYPDYQHKLARLD